MNDAVIEVSIRVSKTIERVTVRISREDHARVMRAVDWEHIVTAREHGRKSTGTTGWRSPWVNTYHLKDRELKEQYERRNLPLMQISHLILGIKPASQKVRYLDGNPLNLTRANMNPYGPKEEQPPRRSHRRSQSELAKEAALTNGELSVRAVSDLPTITVETITVYVVKAGGLIERFATREAAVNRFAEMALDRVQ